MSPVRLSKFESAMRVALDYHKALTRQDLTEMMNVVSDDCIFESASPAPDGGLYAGKAVMTSYWGDYFKKREQVNREIEEIFSVGERCVLRWKSTWVGAAGEEKTSRGVDIFLVEDGVIKQILSYIKG